MDYILRDIDMGLRSKVKATLGGKTMREVIFGKERKRGKIIAVAVVVRRDLRVFNKVGDLDGIAPFPVQ